MHYQRMENQPDWIHGKVIKANPQQWSFATDGVTIVAHPGVFRSMVYGGLQQWVKRPADLPNAIPWRDRDGVWFWRSAPVNNGLVRPA